MKHTETHSGAVQQQDVGRARELFLQQLQVMMMRTDHLFAGLTAIEWLMGLLLATFVSPWVWTGQYRSVHFHVWTAIFLGGTICSLPIVYTLVFPGRVLTRHIVAASQMLMAGLLVHFTEGRIETHFLFFGLLAFLSFYRDWRVLMTATVVAGADHLVRGIVWPQSVYGVLSASPWRTVEHVAYVLFEVMFLVDFIRQSRKQMYKVALRQAQLETVNAHIAAEVEMRTADLRAEIEQREREQKEREQLEVELRHAQKLESIGQLAAGIAHEINTPTQYVGDNVRFLQSGFHDFGEVLECYNRLLRLAKENALSQEVIQRTIETVDNADLEYLTQEIPVAIEHALDGIRRVATLVSALKQFSHPGTQEKALVDLNQAIANTIILSRNEWKYVAEMETRFDPDLPQVFCLPGEMNQVILNLIVNAAHAVADSGKKEGDLGKIVISTKKFDEYAEISVGDTGVGIPPEVRDRIFDPFFTTKEVGRGSGQGLAISRSIIVARHGGTIYFETELGKGTTFYIRLPYDAKSRLSDAASA